MSGRTLLGAALPAVFAASIAAGQAQHERPVLAPTQPVQASWPQLPDAHDTQASPGTPAISRCCSTASSSL